MPVELLA